MPSAITPITSPSHLRTITSSNSYTIIDFYADWCGPCKVISPIFEQLAAQESKTGRLAFVKVDVDAQREVAANYGISAMPTFLVLKGSSVKETVRGANATALRTAVLSAAADAAKGPASGGAGGATFGGAGRALGGEGVAAKPATGPAFTMPNVGAIASSPASYSQERSRNNPGSTFAARRRRLHPKPATTLCSSAQFSQQLCPAIAYAIGLFTTLPISGERNAMLLQSCQADINVLPWFKSRPSQHVTVPLVEHYTVLAIMNQIQVKVRQRRFGLKSDDEVMPPDLQIHNLRIDDREPAQRLRTL
ncbi:hypothetical protein LTR95_002474 [Oleoguttula sp. CCFEE 5521]